MAAGLGALAPSLGTVGLGELGRQLTPGGGGAFKLGGLSSLGLQGGLLGGTPLGGLALGIEGADRLFNRGQSLRDIGRSAERAFEPNRGLGIAARQIPVVGTAFKESDVASARKKAEEERKKERQRVLDNATFAARQTLLGQGLNPSSPAFSAGIAQAGQQAINKFDQGGFLSAMQNVQQMEQQLAQAQQQDAQLAQMGAMMFGKMNPGLFGTAQAGQAGAAGTAGAGAQGAQAAATQQAFRSMSPLELMFLMGQGPNDASAGGTGLA